jgi:nicotinamidase-related amidase
VIIDVQQGMFAFRRRLYQGEETLGRIRFARAGADARVPIFHVQHNGGPGHILAKGSKCGLHHPAVQPRPGEVVIEKQHSSPFHDTDFHTRLSQASTGRLVVAGIQTEMCVDSTCRAAVALATR